MFNDRHCEARSSKEEPYGTILQPFKIIIPLVLKNQFGHFKTPRPLGTPLQEGNSKLNSPLVEGWSKTGVCIIYELL